MKTYTVDISIPNDFGSEADAAAMREDVYGGDYDPEAHGDTRDCYDTLAEAATGAGLKYVDDTDFGAEWRGTAAQIRAALRRAPTWAYFGTPTSDDGDELDLCPAPAHPFGPNEQGGYLRALFERQQMSQRQAAELVGVDQRTVRRWLAVPGSPSFRRLPFAAWYTLRARSGDLPE